MKIGTQKLPGFAVMAALCLCIAPAAAQTKPPESTSKVKKVLLYNKIGGWTSVDGTAEVKAAFSKLAASKGFELVQSADDGSITLDYLKQFQVIVWNNNSNGGSSMPSTAARQAVLDYVNQGGGWMLIHRAADHSDTWIELTMALGTKMVVHGTVGTAQVVLDSAARDHRELKWMLQGFPDAFELNDRWLSFITTVRPLAGVTVIATARGGASDVLRPMADGSGDHVYLWAREIGQGRLIYNAIGFGENQLMEQQDSIVPKLYWENLRYAAKDYYTGGGIPDFIGNPIGFQSGSMPGGLMMSRGGFRIRLASLEGPGRVRLRELSGALVWERALSVGTREITLDGALRPGVYHLEVLGAARAFQGRLVLP